MSLFIICLWRVELYGTELFTVPPYASLTYYSIHIITSKVIFLILNSLNKI